MIVIGLGILIYYFSYFHEWWQDYRKDTVKVRNQNEILKTTEVFNRKFSVGVASVIIGQFFLGETINVPVVQANEVVESGVISQDKGA